MGKKDKGKKDKRHGTRDMGQETWNKGKVEGKKLTPGFCHTWAAAAVM